VADNLDVALSVARAWTRLLVPFLLPAAVLVFLHHRPELDVVFQNVDFHVVVVSAIAGCALVIAAVAARAGARAAHPGPVWLALGCLCVGILMLGHGLLTPGVLGRPMNMWIGRLPYLAITAFAFALVLASRPRNTWLSRLATTHAAAVLCGPSLVAGLFVVALLVDATRWGGGAPFGVEDQLKWVLAGLDWILFVHLARLHWRRWRLGHDPVQYALVLAAAMSAAAMLSLQFAELWRLSWWDYHGYLLAGFGGAVYAIAVQKRRTRAIDGVLTATFEHDPMTHIVQGYPQALRTLVRTVEVKDAYTHGHSERTARVAVQLGLRLGLSEDLLRALARGGYLHDVGKIAIPDHILNKPGRLTADERAVIETHPRIGHELVASEPTLAEVLPAVLHHHERWDGTGYPDELAGGDIPLIARVVAIADVWDALTSDRSYRPGMSPQVALAHIRAGRGTHFEPRLVDAMLALAADWGYVADDVESDPDQGWRAAETCHEVVASRA
jgi:hypothetical protein